MSERYPKREEAIAMLEKAAEINPGAWTDHSRNVAEMAETIASHCAMDSEKAYVLGLLHDIGRSEYRGWNQMHHVIYGYTMLKDSYPEAARICMTHSYVTRDIREYGDQNDLMCSEEEQRFIQNYIDGIEYDDYDLLIQLCDSMCLPDGVTTIEKRLVDVGRRYGTNDLDRDRWNGVFAIKDHFDSMCKTNIYLYFREEIERSIFG